MLTPSTISKTPEFYVAVCLISFIIAITEFLVIAEVINSGVATTFVCLAEDPQTLMRLNPELYGKIREVYPQVQF